MNLPLSNIITLGEKIPTRASSHLIESNIEFLLFFIHTKTWNYKEQKTKSVVVFIQSSLESLKQLEKDTTRTL